jgi:hypothetical protein
VSVDFLATTPVDEPLAPCMALATGGKRLPVLADSAGPVCLNAVAYPGPYDGGAINRAVAGGDAVTVSIPLVGPYLRFDLFATDAAPGSPVRLRVTPRNAGTGTLTGLSFTALPVPEAEWNGVQPGGGWTCRDLGAYGATKCVAPALTLTAGQSTVPVELTFTAPPVPSPPRCTSGGLPFVGPTPDPCATFHLRWTSVTLPTAVHVQAVTYRLAAPPPGPCVMIISNPNIDFGNVAVGTESAPQPVTVASCSSTPINLEASVTSATRSGSTDTWVVSSLPTPGNSAFGWSITPPEGGAAIRVGTTPTRVGAVLAANADRTDNHRIRIGPTGPGVGQAFRISITYTATTP